MVEITRVDITSIPGVYNSRSTIPDARAHEGRLLCRAEMVIGDCLIIRNIRLHATDWGGHLLQYPSIFNSRACPDCTQMVPYNAAFCSFCGKPLQPQEEKFNAKGYHKSYWNVVHPINNEFRVLCLEAVLYKYNACLADPSLIHRPRGKARDPIPRGDEPLETEPDVVSDPSENVAPLAKRVGRRTWEGA